MMPGSVAILRCLSDTLLWLDPRAGPDPPQHPTAAFRAGEQLTSPSSGGHVWFRGLGIWV